jgi:Flp pilus assembly CpaE family ATPase
LKVVSVLSAKGGSGSSLVAPNLGVLLAGHSDCILIDLHPALGYDELLLDLTPERSWADLLPVAEELSARHLELTLVPHSSGLKFISAPERMLGSLDGGKLLSLIEALAQQTSWLILDVPVGLEGITSYVLTLSDVLLLVTTADPPALRAAGRLVKTLPDDLSDKTRLVLNQITRRHPAKPREVAASLGVALLAALPPDPRAVGYQVNFGIPCVLDRRSSLGWAISTLARRIVTAVAQQKRRVEEPQPRLRPL